MRVDVNRPDRSEAVCAQVAIVGAGIAGSLLALELGRQGRDVAVVDPNRVYPPDFRCEKLTRGQIELLDELGALAGVERAELAQRGEAPDTASGLADRGLRYDHMVNAVRGQWSSKVRFLEGRVADIAASDDLQQLEFEDGSILTARLVVLASGPNEKLRARLGVERRLVRERQSVCVGFSITPEAGGQFPFRSMVRQGERAGDGVAFASLFPMAGATRVNLFVYHDPRQPWTRAFRDEPLAQLFEALPGLEPALRGARVVGPVDIRATDLYHSEGHVMAGVALIGDAFRSSCPATGMGVTRALTDVRQLARAHVVDWLATPGMGADKIARFYADPVKRAVDSVSSRKAERGRRSATLTSPPWRLRRWIAARIRSWRRRGADPGAASLAELRS